MQKSDSTQELAKALSTFQGKMVAVKKDAVNPFFKSKYATLDTIWDAIRKPLLDNGLCVVQTLDYVDNSLLETTLLHTSGEWISGSQLLNPVKNDPQGLGSAISYARRYSLSAILGIVADEDDDANVASQKKETPKVSPAKTVSPTAKTPSKSEGVIEQEHIGRILAIAERKGVDTKRLLTHLQKQFGKQSLASLTLEEVRKVMASLTKLPDKEGRLVEEAKKLGAVEDEK